jgi:predicted RNA-binding protein associated with RNAse of E/G family
MMLEGISVNNSEGGIISEFYKMEGKDENSREYSCSKIMLNGSRDNVMNFRLLGTLDSHKEEGSSIRVILAGKYRIPTTGIVNFNTTVDENYWFTDYKDIWKINVNENLKILITNYDDYLDVLINTDEDIEYSDVDDICNSLNFVLGIESESVFTNVMNIGHKVQNRRNILKARSFFDAPLTSHHN